MSQLRRFVIRKFFSRLHRKLEASLMDPRPAQEEALRNLLNRVGGSPLSQKLGFHRVSTLESARRLAITDYSDIEAETMKVRRYGHDADGLFGRSRFAAIAQTSGTTGEPKRIPVTEDYIAAYRGYTLMMNACYFSSTGRWDAMNEGKTLLLTARPRVGVSEGGLPECFISGFMASQVPRWYRKKILPSQELLALPTWEEKMDAILDEARRHQVRSIAAIPALALSLAERAVSRYGVKNLREIWPIFGGLLYSGTTLTPMARKRFDEIFGSTSDNPAIYWEMYAATEAQIGHTFDPSWKGMVFNPFRNFYQFQEDSRSEGSRGPLLHLHELEAGRRYTILLTTPGGLINYRNGDLVEILSTKPLTFRVAGRDKEEISLAGEKINASQFQEAMAKVAQQSDLPIENCVVWGEEGSPNRLVFGLFGGDREPADPARLSKLIDAAMSESNAAYRELRINDMFFGPPKLLTFPESAFRSYRERNLDRGQFKPKLLFKGEEAFRQEYGIRA